jgi:hypothetical protein
LGKKRDNISKITTAKGAGDATQVTEYMLRKCEALNSNSSTTKKKKLKTSDYSLNNNIEFLSA